MACNPRNAFPGTVYSNADRQTDLYGTNIEVDYRGYEVTVENFIRLLTDRWPADVPASKRLNTDRGSNILIYLTGHGGDQFLKFQDSEEIGAWDIAHAFAQMYEKGRYNEILFMIDTCQANTMYKHFYSPGIIATGSSELDESSYSHHADMDVGVAVIDRWTYYILEFLETQVTGQGSEKTLGDLFDSYDEGKIMSRPGVRWDLLPGGESEGRAKKIVDFFGNVMGVEVGNSTANMSDVVVNREMIESWKEDLEGLKRMIKDWEARQGQNNDTDNTTSAARTSKKEEEKNRLDQKAGGSISQKNNKHLHALTLSSTKGLESNTATWIRQIGGLTALSCLAGAWFFGGKLLSI